MGVENLHEISPRFQSGDYKRNTTIHLSRLLDGLQYHYHTKKPVKNRLKGILDIHHTPRLKSGDNLICFLQKHSRRHFSEDNEAPASFKCF